MGICTLTKTTQNMSIQTVLLLDYGLNCVRLVRPLILVPWWRLFASRSTPVSTGELATHDHGKTPKSSRCNKKWHIISPSSFTLKILLASISLCIAVCYAGYRQLQSRPLTVEIKMANERVPRGGSQLPNNDGLYWLSQNGHDVTA